MNFNYSYRAFLITLLIFGGLALIFMSIKFKSFTKEDALIYEIELETVETEVEEENNESELASDTEIETNRAFNQAAEIARLNREQRMIRNETAQRMKEIDRALSPENLKFTNDNKPDSTTTKSLEKRNDVLNEKTAAEDNRNTTIFYNLPGREALRLPNPVYTCEAPGKIVVTIEVNSSGIVNRVNYNRTASSSTNQCLIDAALHYAQRAIFTGDASRNKQLGTITFIFPGQN